MKRNVEKALKRNLADVMEHGPRLSYNRSTAVVATCRAKDIAILTGLGGMGVGSMEVGYGDYKKEARRDRAPDFPTPAAAWAHWHNEMWGTV